VRSPLDAAERTRAPQRLQTTHRRARLQPTGPAGVAAAPAQRAAGPRRSRGSPSRRSRRDRPDAPAVPATRRAPSRDRRATQVRAVSVARSSRARSRVAVRHRRRGLRRSPSRPRLLNAGTSAVPRPTRTSAIKVRESAWGTCVTHGHRSSPSIPASASSACAQRLLLQGALAIGGVVAALSSCVRRPCRPCGRRPSSAQARFPSDA
jgi:hypothetical protein